MFSGVESDKIKKGLFHLRSMRALWDRYIELCMEQSDVINTAVYQLPEDENPDLLAMDQMSFAARLRIWYPRIHTLTDLIEALSNQSKQSTLVSSETDTLKNGIIVTEGSQDEVSGRMRRRKRIGYKPARYIDVSLPLNEVRDRVKKEILSHHIRAVQFLPKRSLPWGNASDLFPEIQEIKDQYNHYLIVRLMIRELLAEMAGELKLNDYSMIESEDDRIPEPVAPPADMSFPVKNYEKPRYSQPQVLQKKVIEPSKVRITFISDEEVEIWIDGSHLFTRHYDALGFVDGRVKRQERPRYTTRWCVLRTIAERNGDLDYMDLLDNNMKDKITDIFRDISNRLTKTFSEIGYEIDDRWFKYVRRKGYKPNFTITDARGGMRNS